MMLEHMLDLIHGAMRRATGLKLVSDLHERPTFPGIYPPLDPKLRCRLRRIRDAGVLFVHIPKNAGMSVSSILYGEQVFHPTIRYYQRVAPDIARSLPSFAIWRHPVERFVSAFRYARTGGSQDAPISRAFQKTYRAFRTLDDALDHVASANCLYQVDHIFRPQFWYIADHAGRIAVDNICMIEDLDAMIAAKALPGLHKVARLNRSEAIDVALTSDQLQRLHDLYPIDFAIYDSLQQGLLAKRLTRPDPAFSGYEANTRPPLSISR